MRNIVLRLIFDGTRYHGWQVQENAVTIQQTVQDAFEKVFGKRLDVTGCSRTDAGVHANGYVCSFKTDVTIPCDAILRALNANLPKDIAVISCGEAPSDFHVRYSTTAKEYIYKIWNSPVRNPFLAGYTMFYPKKLDAGELNLAAQNFIGRHDFAAFRSAGAVSRHRPALNENAGEISGETVRTIFEANVAREGDLVIFRVRGDGFLYNMVRIMTGTLLFVAQGKISCDAVKDVIESKNRKKAGPTAPACGLYLSRVFYGGRESEISR